MKWFLPVVCTLIGVALFGAGIYGFIHDLKIWALPWLFGGASIVFAYNALPQED